MSLKELKILPTKSTPEIILKPDGYVKIKGRAMKVNVLEFTRKIENWIDEYVCDPAELTCIDFYLEYTNDINCKIFIMLLRKIESVKLKNKKYIINWYYEEGDEDMIEKGEYVSYILEMPFNFIKIYDPLLPQNIHLDLILHKTIEINS